jgi:CheY-like chemotaxis protein
MPDMTDTQGLLEVAENGSRLLLILTSSDVQSAAQLAQASQLTPAQTLQQLERLVDRALIIAGDEAGVAVYRLTPMGSRPDALDPSRRVLVVEDDLALRELFVTMLDQEGTLLSAPARSSKPRHS